MSLVQIQYFTMRQMKGKKICKTCGVEFDINKWQTKQVYCNDACNPTFSPNRGKPRGRPKDEWKEVFERYDI